MGESPGFGLDRFAGTPGTTGTKCLVAPAHASRTDRSEGRRGRTLYCVIKGAHVACLTIGFEQGDTSIAGDPAILAGMAARLP